ncbi:MAG: multidrug effflux MFS transporter [Puniceicoccales bacterium]|jgi:DHA1 family bicyclomycin/chloramphenicol resistance-like MFS transporter|nr:multidrug effflux MFS transporter [Puniceicoccales bacterium]
MPLPDNKQATGTLSMKSRWRLIFILASLAAFGPLAIDMYLPAFPQIASDLHAPQGAVQLSLSVFLIGVSLGQLIYGPLSDRFGRRYLLLFGTALFVFSALGCAFTNSAPGLIGWRLVMALGGSAGMGLSRAIIRDKFAVHEAAEAFSMLALVMGAAPIIAPLLGGQVLEAFGWRTIFGVLATLGTAVWLAVWFWLPESLPADKRKQQNVAEAVRGYGALLTNKAFMGYALVLGFNAGALFTYITCAPHIFIELNGMTPQVFSLFFGINSLGMIGGAQINRHLLRRFTPRHILSITLALVASAGLLLAVCALAGIGGFPALIVLLFLTLASGGLVGPNATALALSPFERSVGSAAALLGTLQFGMGGLAGALAGAFGNHGAMPMCATLAVCAFVCFAAFHTLTRRTS